MPHTDEDFRTEEELESQAKEMNEDKDLIKEAVGGIEEEDKQKITFHDISFYEDLFFAIMNVEAAEEHLEIASGRTGKVEYLEIANEISKIRAKYCPTIERNKDPEIHCLSKHLKLIFKRLEEAGIKYARIGKMDKALELQKDAFATMKIYWAIQKLGEDEKHDNKR